MSQASLKSVMIWAGEHGSDGSAGHYTSVRAQVQILKPWVIQVDMTTCLLLGPRDRSPGQAG